MADTPLQLDSLAKLLSALPQQADFGQGDGWNDLSPRSSLNRASQARPEFADVSRIIVNRKENIATRISVRGGLVLPLPRGALRPLGTCPQRASSYLATQMRTRLRETALIVVHVWFQIMYFAGRAALTGC